MISQTMQDAINEQINKELYSEYLYLSMAAYLDAMGLSGMANFMKVQGNEERFHAMKFYNFINDRGGRVVLKAIDQPDVEFDNVLDVFEKSLKHEEFVSKSINDLMDLAIQENDHASKSLLNWFVDEQVEEEDTFNNLIDQMRLINGQGHGMLMLDKEMGQRTFTPPAE